MVVDNFKSALIRDNLSPKIFHRYCCRRHGVVLKIGRRSTQIVADKVKAALIHDNLRPENFHRYCCRQFMAPVRSIIQRLAVKFSSVGAIALWRLT